MKRSFIAVIINIIVIAGIVFFFNSNSKFENIKSAVATKTSTMATQTVAPKATATPKTVNFTDEYISTKLGITATLSYNSLLAEKNFQEREIDATWTQYHAYNVVRPSDEIVMDSNGNEYTLWYGISEENVSSVFVNRNGAKLIVRIDDNTKIDTTNTENFKNGGTAQNFYKNVFCSNHVAIKGYDNTCYANAISGYRPEFKKVRVIANIFNAFVIVKRNVVIDNQNVEVYMWAVKTCEEKQTTKKSSSGSRRSSNNGGSSDNYEPAPETPDHNNTPAPETDKPDHNNTPAPETDKPDHNNTPASEKKTSNESTQNHSDASAHSEKVASNENSSSHSNLPSSSTSSMNENAKVANDETNW